MAHTKRDAGSSSGGASGRDGCSGMVGVSYNNPGAFKETFDAHAYVVHWSRLLEMTTCRYNNTSQFVKLSLYFGNC